MLEFGLQVHWVGSIQLVLLQLSVCQKQFQYCFIAMADFVRWLLPTHDSNSLLPWPISNMASSNIAVATSASHARN